jgi:uncharacterized protein with HEPN domain
MALPRSPAERLADIANAISKIEKFLAGKTFADFMADPLTHDAVVRNLEIISEASRHLGDLTGKRPKSLGGRLQTWAIGCGMATIS